MLAPDRREFAGNFALIFGTERATELLERAKARLERMATNTNLAKAMGGVGRRGQAGADQEAEDSPVGGAGRVDAARLRAPAGGLDARGADSEAPGPAVRPVPQCGLCGAQDQTDQPQRLRRNHDASGRPLAFPQGCPAAGPQRK